MSLKCLENKFYSLNRKFINSIPRKEQNEKIQNDKKEIILFHSLKYIAYCLKRFNFFFGTRNDFTRCGVGLNYSFIA